MILVIVVFFILAALMGVALLSYLLRDKFPPKHIAKMHGLVAATGLVLLIIYSVLYQPAPIVSLVIFGMAAMGGGTLMYKGLTGNPIPKALAIGHGLTALTGLIFLICFVVCHG